MPFLWHWLQKILHLAANFNFMQWTCWKCLKEERISNPKNSVWPAGLFWNWMYYWADAFQKLSYNRLWIYLRARRKLQRHRCNKMDWRAYFLLVFHFPKSFGGTKSSLHFWSLSSRYFFYRFSSKFSYPMQSNNYKIVLQYRDNTEKLTGQHLGESYPT